VPDPFYEDCFVKLARVQGLSDVEAGFVKYQGRSPGSPSIRASLKAAPHATYALKRWLNPVDRGAQS